MSETLLGIIIGGAIGVVPTLVMVFVEVWKQRCQLKHELAMRRMDLIDKPRLEALREYCHQLGAACSPFNRASENSKENYLSALEKAVLYVSPATRDKMIEITPAILEEWERPLDKLRFATGKIAKIHELNEALQGEIYLSCDKAV